VSTAEAQGVIPRIGRNTGGLLAARALQAVAQAAALVLIARDLRPAAYGLFALVVSLRLMTAIVADFGILQILTSRLVGGDEDRAELLATSLGLRLALAAGAAVVLVALGFIASDSGSVHAGCLVAALSLFPQAIFVGVQALAQSELQLGRVAVAIVASGITAVATAALVLGFTHSVPLLALMLVTSNVAAAVVGWMLTPRGRVGLSVRVDRAAWLRLLRDAAPVGIAIGLTTLYFNIDMLLLARLSTTEQLGLYDSVYRYMQVGVIVPSVLVSASYAVVAAALDDQARSRAVLRRVLAITTLIAPLGLLLVAVSPGAIVTFLYGDAYRPAAPALRILGGALAVGILSGVLAPMLVAAGERRRSFHVAIAGLVANIAMNLVLIPPYGARGAAWATLGTDVVVAAYAYGLLRRRFQAGLFSPALFAVIGACAVGLATGLAVSDAPFPLAILAAVGAYGVTAALIRYLHPALDPWRAHA
jgi:O-antigen/teichoic acid export membrane protein